MGRKRTGLLYQGEDGIFRARVTEKGSRPVYSLETRDEAAARRRLRELLARIEREEKEGADRRKTPSFEASALEWLAARTAKGVASVASDRPLLANFAFPVFGAALVGDVVAGDVRRALEKAQLAGRKRGTLVHLLNAIRSVLHVAWQDNLCRENPALKCEVPEAREVKKTRAVLTDEELGRLWAAPVDLEIKIMTVVARTVGGMRTRDVVALDWIHVDLEAFSWTLVARTKTARPQRIEIPEPLRPALRAWWAKHGSPSTGPVFPVTRGRRKGERRGARNVSFADRLRRALHAAGVDRRELFEETADTKPLDFHSCRRGFAQALDDADGVSRKEAMRLSGHSSEAAHLRYLQRAGRPGEVLALPPAVVPALSTKMDVVDAEIVSDGDAASLRGRAVDLLAALDAGDLERARLAHRELGALLG